MKRILMLAVAASLTFTSCVSSKKYNELQNLQNETADKLSNTKSTLAALEAAKKSQDREVNLLRLQTAELMKQVGDLTRLSAANAENMEKTLESISEKELTITRLQDAMNRKDSVNFALVSTLKSALGDLSDQDVEISVEKGVVYINLSDNLMFKPGSSNVSKDAHNVLGKVAKILEARPNFEILVEGHTDTDPIATDCVRDNWDLSVRRATSIVRILMDDFNVAPERMTAAGRSEYVPVASNETREGRAQNRRTRIVVLPKLDEFNKLINEGLGN